MAARGRQRELPWLDMATLLSTAAHAARDESDGPLFSHFAKLHVKRRHAGTSCAEGLAVSTLSFMPAEPPGGPRRPGGPHPDLPDPRADLVRRHPIGAEVVSDGVSFRVWAPACRRGEVVFEGSHDAVDLVAEEGGYFSAVAAGAAAGDLYRFRLDAGDTFPDPASRFQPQGPHGPSCVVDPAAYEWHGAEWGGATLAGQVLYEIHIASYTPEGTWAAAAARLHELAALGITMLEVMLLAPFPGSFGGGDDGVDLFAPTHLYGSPDDFRRFVDRAHSLGLAVILD